MPFHQVAGFVRSPLPDKERIILIESKCVYCGFEIIGSVGDGLPDKEQQHAIICPERLDNLKARIA
jgi:hypothetical protein